MSTKRKARRKKGAAKEITQRPFFYTVDGRKVTHGVVSLVELEMAENGIEKYYRTQEEPIDQPQYQVPGAGDMITLTLDEESIDAFDSDGQPDLEETERRQVLWTEHLAARQRMEQEQNRSQQELMFEVIDVVGIESPGWRKRQEKYHIEIPDDEDDLRTHYIMTMLLRTPEDIIRAMGSIMASSTSGILEEEAVEAAVGTFRYQISTLVIEEEE